jgi:hypothetical protein
MLSATWCFTQLERMPFVCFLGCWLAASLCWFLLIGCVLAALLLVGFWLLAAPRCWPLAYLLVLSAACCRLLAAPGYCWLLAAGRWVLPAAGWQLALEAGCCWLLDAPAGCWPQLQCLY